MVLREQPPADRHCGLLVKALHQVPVLIEREADAGVAHPLRNDPDVGPRLDQVGDGRVSEVVQADPRQP